MEDRSNADLATLLETVQQITKAYAQSVPKPEDIAKITQAYAQLYPNMQSVMLTAQQSEGLTGSEADTAKGAFTVPTPEQIAQMREAAAQFVPVDTQQTVIQTTAQESPEAEELIRTVMSALQASGASAFSRAGEPAADALIALQRTLEGKPAPAPQTFDPSARPEDRPRSIWKAVYLALGVLIVAGLILTLAVPQFRDALGGMFR